MTIRILRIITAALVFIALAISSTLAQKGYDLGQQDVATEPALGSPQEGQQAGANRMSSLFAEPLTRPVTLPQSGRVSPDGQFVAFTENSLRDLTIRTIATGETRKVVTRTAPELVLAPSWSKDGKQLGYEVCVPPTAGAAALCDLRVIGTNGSGEHVILPRSTNSPVILDWMPDGRSVAVRFNGRPSADTSLFALVSIADGTTHELTVLKNDELLPCFDTLGISPDGRYLAYSRGVSNKPCDIFVLASDGSGERPLIQHAADDRFLAWTPGGSVLFTSDRSGTTDIWLAHIENGRVGGLPERLKRDVARRGSTNTGIKVPGRVFPLGLTMDGALYYGVPATGNGEVYVAELGSTGQVLSSPAPISQSSIGHTGEARWSNDGRYFTYTTMASNTNAYDTVTLVSLDTGDERHIQPKPPLEYIHNSPGWTADGRYLFIDALSAGGWDIYKVDAQTGDAKPLGIGQRVKSLPAALPGAELLPDGRTVVYQAGTVLVTLDLETRSEHTVYSAETNTRFNNLALSKDGTQVALVLMDSNKKTNSLIVVDLATGRARQVVQLQNALDGAKKVTWSPDGRYLVYVERPQAQVSMEEGWRIAVNGGSPERIGLRVIGSLEFLRVHPDGRHLAFLVISNVPGGTYVLDRLVPANDRLAPAVRHAP